jgi:hypothetical protein
LAVITIAPTPADYIIMAAYKTPDFTERAALAREAKQRALDQLRAKPAPDAATIAARHEALAAREAAAAEKRAAKLAAAEAAKVARAEAKAAAELARKESEVAPPTEAELKAARDARYAARKTRRR